jgi:Carboxypeptidase regulatory-like domain
MRSFKSALFLVALFSLLSSAFAQAATISGTVTNKTTGKPSAGDKVELVDVQAGMSVAANAKTNASGHFSLDKPGSGPYLVRVIHQGSPYFIAAPDGAGPADVSVYDAAPDVGAVRIEADVVECEAENGKLSVNERYFVHNTSSPPRTQYNPDHGFEIVLPPDAVVDGTAARRPSGLPTSTNLKPASEKNHFTFDFPIQPDEGDKDTLFQVSYHLPYSSGQYTFKPQMLMPADNVAFLLPKSFAFKGAGFTSVPQDPGIQTMLAKNVQPGQELSASVSGTGSMPREAQAQQPSANTSSQDSGSQDTSNPGTGPGGGIGQPIGTPDPLTKYKWWILAGLALTLAAAAGFLLRKPAGAATAPVSVPAPAAYPTPSPRRTAAATPARASAAAPVYAAPVYSAQQPSAASHNASLLTVLKEEMFAIESEKLSGTLSAAEYKEQKSALEVVLKRALKKQGS